MTAISGTITRRSRSLIRWKTRLSETAPARWTVELAPAPKPDSHSFQYIEKIVSSYGYNSTSYLALESDKKHFFHSAVAGVTACAEFNKVVITAGEPICPQNEMGRAVDEFLAFSASAGIQPIFFEVTEPVVPVLQSRGFRFLKLGEEPFFELDRFTLKGNKMANVRSSGNTARNRGVTVREYHPTSAEAVLINPQLEAISQDWLQTRGIGELSFTLGTLSLDKPGNRRYFIAEQNNRVVAFVTYTPVCARQGVYLDLMRRSESAPTGTMDLLLSESFLLLKSSGVKLATMGMSPLSNVKESEVEQSEKLAWILHEFSVRGDSVYHFKHLHDFKRKFQPHFWESKYLAYRHLGVRELDAILQALLRQSLGGLIWWALNQPIF